MFDKDFWNRQPEFRGNDLVGIKQCEPRSPLQATSDGRLPCAHHPDQNDRFAATVHWPNISLTPGFSQMH
jgi:hypothetical protein